MASSSPPREWSKAPSPPYAQSHKTPSPTVTDTLMKALEPWVEGFTDLQLRPFGQVPAETVAFSRRHSRQALNNIEIVRVPLQLPVTNRGGALGIMANVEVIAMTFTPPIELGVNSFTVNIPSQWWKGLKLRPEDVRAALKEEIRALLEGSPARNTFLTNYITELRNNLEDHIRTLPATMFDLNQAYQALNTSPSSISSGTSNGSPNAANRNRHRSLSALPAPASFTYNDWTTTRHILLEEGITRLTIEGPDVEMQIVIPNDLHQSTSAIQDWVILQVCL